MPPHVVEDPILSISVSRARASVCSAALSALVAVSLDAYTANSLILKSRVCTSFKAASPVSITDWAS